MSLKVVDFENRSELDKKVKEQLLMQVEELKNAIKDGTISQIALQWQQPSSDDKGKIHVVFWNDSDDVDRMIGFADRLKMRIAAFTGAIDNE